MNQLRELAALIHFGYFDVYFSSLWDIESDGEEEGWEDVGGDPAGRGSAHLHRPVEQRSVGNSLIATRKQKSLARNTNTTF